MSLRIEQREVEGIVVLSLNGRLVIGAEVSSVQDAIQKLLEKQENRLILDLKEVGFIDSTGLGALVSAHSAFEKADGAMRLLNLSERTTQLLVLTKLSLVFKTFTNEQAAIDSFFPDRESRRFDILEFVRSQDETADEAAAQEGAKEERALTLGENGENR
jgi:anti-sigma B factor antagonist